MTYIYNEHCSVTGDEYVPISITSKDDILKASRELIRQQGCSAISIRSVANACGVSVGSIYNYFESKADLIIATVESVWYEIFHHPEDKSVLQNTLSYINWLYQRMNYGHEQYPGFFTLHSLGFVQQDKSDGRKRMQHAWEHILNGFCFVIKSDPNVRSDAFTEQFTTEKFADILFSLMLAALFRQDYDPSATLEIVRRTIY